MLGQILYDYFKSCLQNMAWFMVSVVLFIGVLEILIRFPTILPNILKMSPQMKLFVKFTIILVLPKSKMFKIATFTVLFWMK